MTTQIPYERASELLSQLRSHRCEIYSENESPEARYSISLCGINLGILDVKYAVKNASWTEALPKEDIKSLIKEKLKDRQPGKVETLHATIEEIYKFVDDIKGQTPQQ